jgi:hypothetical protein
VNPIRTLLRTLSRFTRRVYRRVFYRNEFRPRVEFMRPQFGFGLYKFGNDDDRTGYYSLKLFFCWVYLCRSNTQPKDDMCDSWAVNLHLFADRYLYLTWGERSRFVYLPWSFDWIETALMTESGDWIPIERNYRGRHENLFPGYPFGILGDHLPGTIEPQSYPFTYVTRAGEVQRTTVTVRKVERRKRQWRLFRKLRIPLAIATTYSLDIQFADEMGSERGSWKGGVLGTGCAYRPGESIESEIGRYELLVNLEHRFCR